MTAGADLPFADPARGHRVAMEGSYWRIADERSGRVVVVLCGSCATAGRRWSLVAVAAHPGGHVASLVADGGSPHQRRFGASAGAALEGDARRLRARLGPRTWVDLEIEQQSPWPRRAFGGLGPAQVVPRLPQYWHPVLLDARASGEVCLDGERIELAGARLYAEKNWGPGFPGVWWWGQAFTGEDATVAFAGGRIGPLGPTAVVVRAGRELVRLVPPLAFVRAEASGGEWRVSARSPRHSILVEGEATGAPHVLPVPDPRGATVSDRSRQHLAGRLRVELRRGRRVLHRGESELAGLELGAPRSL